MIASWRVCALYLRIVIYGTLLVDEIKKQKMGSAVISVRAQLDKIPCLFVVKLSSGSSCDGMHCETAWDR